MEYEDLKVSVPAKDLELLLKASADSFISLAREDNDPDVLLPHIRVASAWALNIITKLEDSAVPEDTADLVSRVVFMGQVSNVISTGELVQALNDTPGDVVVFLFDDDEAVAEHFANSDEPDAAL